MKLKNAERKSLPGEPVIMIHIHSLALSLPQRGRRGMSYPTPTLRSSIGVLGDSSMNWHLTQLKYLKTRGPGSAMLRNSVRRKWTAVGEGHFHTGQDVGELPINHTRVSWEPAWTHLQRDLAQEVYQRESRGVEGPMPGAASLSAEWPATSHITGLVTGGSQWGVS